MTVAGLTHAGPIELVTNGDFEAGLAGWVVTDQAGGSGSWYSNGNGAVTPVSGFATAVNPSGDLLIAITDQGGPGTHALTQTIVVPASTSVILSFDYFINDQSGLGPLGTLLDFTVLPTQFGTADVLTSGADPFDTGAGVVTNVLYGEAAGAGLPHDWVTVTSDITAFVGGGGTFQLRFAETDNQLFFNFGLDNVSVVAVPEPGTLALLGTGLAALAGVRRRRARR
jgi:hypothetical protein